MADRRRIRFVHWKASEVPERTARLEAEGYEVDGEVPGTSIGVKALREDPPAAFVIDLGRLPSHGREVAFAVRQSKALRGIPIVFVGGAEAKVDSIRTQLPDATFTVWDEIAADLRAGDRQPARRPGRPRVRLRSALGQARSSRSSGSRRARRSPWSALLTESRRCCSRCRRERASAAAIVGAAR